jgi:hypothetical protein
MRAHRRCLVAEVKQCLLLTPRAVNSLRLCIHYKHFYLYLLLVGTVFIIQFRSREYFLLLAQQLPLLNELSCSPVGLNYLVLNKVTLPSLSGSSSNKIGRERPS